MRRLVAAAAVLAATLSSGASGQEIVISPESTSQQRLATGTQWTVGLGAGVVPEYQGGDDYHAVPLWSLRAQNLYHPNTYAQLLATMFTSNLVPAAGFRLGPMFQFIPKRGHVQNNQVDDLENVDPSLMLGAVLGYDFKLGEQRGILVEALGRQDVADGNGFLGTLQATYRQPFGASWFTTVGVETTYASSDYMQAYFGVSGSDADQSGLDEFDADSGFKDVGINFSLGYALSRHWDITGLGAYRRLVDDAEDSPITQEGDEDQWYGGVLVNYHF